MIKTIWYFAKIILIILLLAFVVLFFISNSERIVLNLFPFSLEMKLYTLVVLCLVIGFMLGLFISAKNIFKANMGKKQEIKELKKELKGTKKDCGIE